MSEIVCFVSPATFFIQLLATLMIQQFPPTPDILKNKLLKAI